jgi:nicotinamide mononucleotide transporter
MPAIYLFVYYDAGLYADTAINIYYLAIALYGWAAWKWGFSFSSKSKEQPQKKLPISHITTRGWIAMVTLYAVMQLAITAALTYLTDSDVAWFNGLTSALSIVGMYMLARKYIEQWWVWLVVDILSAGLYFYKGLHFTAVLYAVYAVIAIAGYMKWKRLMREQYAEK